MLLVLLAATVAGFLKHKRKLQLLVIPFMISMGGFIFNITSPGTKVRQAAFEMRPGVFGTIVLSIEKTLEDLNDWLNFSFVLMLIILIPILLNMAIRIYKNTDFRFSNPLLIVIVSVGCLCLLRCPPYYAMGNDGAGRIDNIVFFVFVLFSIANEFYILGWLYAKGYLHIEKGTLLSGKNLVCIILLLLVSVYGSKGDNNFYEAYCELKSGEVQQYDNENEARWDLLLDGTNADVVLQPHSVKPKLLFFSDIEHNPEDGKNSSMKEYYKKYCVFRR